MISICIPIYNYNVTDLVTQLSEQIDQLDCLAEMILIDDGSADAFRAQNEGLCSTKKYIKLEKNIGRSAIRNLFLNYAKYEHLLFLDCDALIPSDFFLRKYVDAIKNYPDPVFCGGRIYPEKRPNRNNLLRWRYGVRKESQPYAVRSKNPNRSFMTNNFLIRTKVFEAIKFDESLVGYGHEDTLFGFELKKNNVQIVHIDNPILNGDYEENETYLHQTEKGISNLVQMLKYKNYDKNLIEDVTLLRTYYKLYTFRKPIKIVFRLCKPVIKYFLAKGFVSLYLFDFYKLGILTVIMGNES